MGSLLDRTPTCPKGHAVVGRPPPLIVGATDVLLEAGEEPTAPSLPHIPRRAARRGPASFAIGTERRLGGEGRAPSPRAIPWGASRGRQGAKGTKAPVL